MNEVSETMKFHHIGVACENIDNGIKNMRKIYDIVSVSEVVFDEQQNAFLCLIETGHGVNIELVAGGQVKDLFNRGISYYHICYTVTDINKEIERLKKQGAVVISPPKPAILFNNKLVSFLYTDVGLIELLEVSDM